MKKIAHYIVVITTLFNLSSCSYLDVVPAEMPELKDAMKDRPTTLGFLYSCYSHFGSLLTSHNSYINSTDEYVWPLLWANDSQQASWNLLTPSAQTYPWNQCYSGIGQCDLFLQEIDKHNPLGVTSEDKKRWKAEAMFCKAVYHFVLLETYGPIPIILTRPGQNIDKKDIPGRSHFDACVDVIAAWFDQSAEDLLLVNIKDDELGRATSSACKAFKARLLVYAASPLWNGSFPFPNWKNTNFETPGYGQELVSKTYDAKKWERAKDACDEALEYATTYGKRKLFDLEASKGIRDRDNVPLPIIDGTDDEFKEKVMQMRYLCSTRETDGNRETIFGVANGDYGMSSVLPHGITIHNGSAVGGWGAVAPCLSTVERFYTKSGKLPANDPAFTPQSEWFESAGLANSNIIKLNNNREPRFYAWLCFDGGEYGSFVADGESLIIEARNSQKHGYNPDKYNRDNGETGYYAKKRIQPLFSWRASDNGHNDKLVPITVIRLAELYLNLAECYAALGEDAKALTNLNIIRDRAGIPELASLDITADMTLVDWVRNERFVELWFEGHRYYDARRWVIAPQVFKTGAREGLNAIEKKDPSFEEFNKRTVVNQPFQWDDRMYLMPINNDEIFSNPQLVQSPKY